MSSNSAEPNQTTGNYHSIKGQVVEGIGNLTGSTEWQTSGKKVSEFNNDIALSSLRF